MKMYIIFNSRLVVVCAIFHNNSIPTAPHNNCQNIKNIKANEVAYEPALISWFVPNIKNCIFKIRNEKCHANRK